MELKLVKIVSDELDSNARCILALKNEPFFFLWYQGKVLMNREMKGIRKITEAVKTMWEYMLCDNPAFDAAYDAIEELAGDKAAYQALSAWHTAVKEFSREKGKAEASRWYADTYQELSEDAWSLMYENGYDDDFLLGILKAHYKAEEDSKTSSRRVSSDRPIFAYAFMCGMEAARKEASAQ